MEPRRQKRSTPKRQRKQAPTPAASLTPEKQTATELPAAPSPNKASSRLSPALGTPDPNAAARFLEMFPPPPGYSPEPQRTGPSIEALLRMKARVAAIDAYIARGDRRRDTFLERERLLFDISLIETERERVDRLKIPPRSEPGPAATRVVGPEAVSVLPQEPLRIEPTAAETQLAPQPASHTKQRGRPIARVEQERRKTLKHALEAYRKKKGRYPNGEEYPKVVNDAGVETSQEWQEDEHCPPLYPTAYAHTDRKERKKWRKRFRNEEYRLTRESH